MLELGEAIWLTYMAGDRPPLVVKFLLSTLFFLAIAGIVCGVLVKLGGF